eukprot:364762_1
MAIGHYNDTIYLLGGVNNPYQMVQYDIKNSEFTDYTTTYLSDNTGSQISGQYYTSLSNILYMIHPDGNRFSTFDLTTKIFQSDWNSIRIPTDVNAYGCLASTTDYLFVLGGFSGGYLNRFQALKISTMIWSTSISSLNTARGQCCCNFHPTTNEVYAIGGEGSSGTIEKINVENDIFNRGWGYIDNLLDSSIYSRSMIHKDTILVVGGRYTDAVQVIDITTGQLSSGGHLSYAVSRVSAIIVNNIAYVFGGRDANGYSDIWQYVLLSTTSPSQSPSISPITSNAQTLVKSFGFHTASPAASTSIYPINITLNYDSIIYHCQVIPNAVLTEFPCDGSLSVIPSSGCNIISNLMFVENTHYVSGNINGCNLDYVFIVDSNDVKTTVTVGASRQFGFIVLDQNDYQSNVVLVDIDQQTDDIFAPNFYPCPTSSPTTSIPTIPTTSTPTTTTSTSNFGIYSKWISPNYIDNYFINDPFTRFEAIIQVYNIRNIDQTEFIWEYKKTNNEWYILDDNILSDITIYNQFDHIGSDNITVT